MGLTQRMVLDLPLAQAERCGQRLTADERNHRCMLIQSDLYEGANEAISNLTADQMQFNLGCRVCNINSILTIAAEVLARRWPTPEPVQLLPAFPLESALPAGSRWL